MDVPSTDDIEGQASSPNNNAANQTYEATLACIMDFMERQESHRVLQDERIDRMSREGGGHRKVETITDDKALERFLKFHPTRFGGKGDEQEAEKWLEAINDIYGTLQYTDAQQVRFAAFQLEGLAKSWWRMVE
ncbi:hypothetical protein BPMI_03628 [Candidatus Burkholderia pumila]|uniref:Uncharacterized protein n=1 Tax=Candidatus Burkholderia pumila TaxID=1090375 RepID=A0ABR5HJW0_9BURK|nr:hypothetical protein BPMI_03628 [Candidatus Burkholderia pumila]